MKVLMIIVLIPITLIGQTLPEPILVSTLPDTMYLTWDPPEDPDPLTFRVHIARRSLSGIWDTTQVVVPDTFMVYPTSNIQQGVYHFGVSAIDPSGNEGLITWANNCSDPNMFGYCWYLAFDAMPPGPVRSIRPVFKQ